MINTGDNMKKILLAILALNISVYADLDLGEDFEPGDLVTAEAFNSKFNKLNKVVGEIKDADILGAWNCTTYMVTLDPEFADGGFMIENGGNGQVGSGYFFSNSGTLTFTEINTDTSLNSPKMWEASKGDLIEDGGNLSGEYSLVLNKLHLFYKPFDEIRYGAIFNIEILDDGLLALDLDEGFDTFLPRSNLVCERATS